MRKKDICLISGCLIILITILSGCSAPTSTSQTLSTTGQATPVPISASVAPTSTAPAKPQGELVAALPNFGNENFLPWKCDTSAGQLTCIVYDILTYWDEINMKFLPGLAESWELAPDGMTLTYHLREGVQFHDGWGEMTAEDIKFNFERHSGLDSIGKMTAARNIASMDMPDLYTLVLHFKNPAPTFYMEFSFGTSGNSQGMVSKKYVETVGEEEAAQKPIGSGPFKLIDSRLGDYYKFEALDIHWRVVPEFKTLIVRSVPEMSTTIAMLKTKEVDMANVTAEQLSGLKTFGLGTEISPVGGSVINIAWGGICLPLDFRYKADYHNKDPWVDMKVRKALTISIDRQAICDSIFAGGAIPAGVPLISTGMQKYQHPFDPTTAKQLLTDAGYPNGFSFKILAFPVKGVAECPRVIEAMVGYWKQIGLDAQIVVSEQTTYVARRQNLKVAGELAPQPIAQGADMLEKATMFLMPGGAAMIYQDEGSYAIWKEGVIKINADERNAYVEKLNKYYFENYGPIPVIKIGYSYAWNSDKIAAFPHTSTPTPYYLEYVRHAQSTNTFRLFSPWEGR